MVSSGVHVFVSSSKQKKSHLGKQGAGVSQFIAFVIYLDSFLWNNTHIFNFLMLEGVWIKVGTSKIFAKQNGGRFVEIVDLAPFDAPQGYYHVIIGIKPCHQKLVLSISPRESVWGGGISPRPNGLGEIP